MRTHTRRPARDIGAGLGCSQGKRAGRSWVLLDVQKEPSGVDGEIIARVERRRQWTPQEKAALLAEVEASEPNSNHHSLSYDLPRTELDRVGRVHADLCRDFFSRAVA